MTTSRRMNHKQNQSVLWFPDVANVCKANPFFPHQQLESKPRKTHPFWLCLKFWFRWREFLTFWVSKIWNNFPVLLRTRWMVLNKSLFLCLIFQKGSLTPHSGWEVNETNVVKHCAFEHALLTSKNVLCLPFCTTQNNKTYTRSFDLSCSCDFMQIK